MAPVDAFSQSLAGLAQNVLDISEQDADEVHDSLAFHVRTGGQITFVHKDIALRFSKEGRAYNSMSHVVGGEPYWLLVQLVLGHNQALLRDLHHDLERHHGRGGAGRMMTALLRLPWRLHSVRHAEHQLRRTLFRRIRLAHYIPNLFRYPTEQQLYRLFTRARGLEAQREYLSSLGRNIETTVQGISILSKERADSRIARMILALGLVQAAGALVALAAIQQSEFEFLGTHFDLADAATFLHELGNVGPGHNLDDNVFRAVWALMPALVIMSLGFVMMGLISFAWMAYWLLARTWRR
jgi:hypothetical protein